MNQKITFFLLFALPLCCVAQTQLARMYSYDAAGNRTVCAVINLSPPQAPSPTDSTETESVAEIESTTPLLSPDLTDTSSSEPEYFVERMGNVEIRIYPNPTTEKITLDISEWGNLQTGVFKLYSLSGQLLQEQPVHSATTTVSLAGFARGAYILKVNINNRTEDWKIIKQ